MSRFNFRKSKTPTPEVTPEVVKTSDELLQESIKKHRSMAVSSRALRSIFYANVAFMSYAAYNLIDTEFGDSINVGEAATLSFLGLVATTGIYVGNKLGSDANVDEAVAAQLTVQSELNKINAQPVITSQPSTNPLELDF